MAVYFTISTIQHVVYWQCLFNCIMRVRVGDAASAGWRVTL